MFRSKFFYLFLCALAAAPIALIEVLQVPPRELARYVERRASGHNPMMVRIGDGLAGVLRRMDRGEVGAPVLAALTVGARADASSKQESEGVEVPVTTPAELEAAIARARPGEVITLRPGVYRLGGRTHVEVAQPGLAGAPITVRATVAGSALIESASSEGFRVSAAYWTFENLHIRGICGEQSSCEHAFHIVGRAVGFVARNNTVEDFNAHFKINGESGDFPDRGLIEGNTLVNRSVRETDSPVTPIDLVAASGWTIRGNVIADFIKGQGDRTSFGAFAKGGGADTVIEHNIVICEHRLRGLPGQRVGLSLGGGGSENQYCRGGDCSVEHSAGVIRANLIQSCSDDGIYLNRARGVKITHNTLIDTGGVSVRFATSEAVVEGNLIDGLLRERDGGRLQEIDNVGTPATQLYFGRHPVRSLFLSLTAGRLDWKSGPPRRAVAADPGTDLCGSRRPAQPAYGAIEDFAACAR